MASLTASWQQWDGNWFTWIVEHGYRAAHHAPEPSGLYLRPAFYPGYPLLARGVYELLHPLGMGVTAALLLTNQLLVFPMAILLFLLARELTGSSERGVRTVQYLLVFPFAYFLLAPYSETLFLLCVAGFAWALITRRYGLAAAFGAVGTATRPAGLVLPVVLAIALLEQHRWRWRSLKLRDVGLTLGSLSGAVVYAIYQWIEFGQPTYAQHVEWIFWGRKFTVAVWNVIAKSFGHPPLSAGRVLGQPVEVFIVLPLLVAFLLLSRGVWTRYGAPMGALCALLVLVPLCSGSTLSLNRYMLAPLPCFVLLAGLTRRGVWDFAYRTVGAVCAALFLVMFTHGIWTG
jgi:hypothetical protein